MTRARRDRDRAGPRLTRVGDGQATAALDGPGAGADPPTDAVVRVASAAALAAGASAPDRPADAPAPVLVSLTLDLFRPDPRGALTADAAISYRGRRSQVVHVKVHDARARLIAAIVMTQLDGVAAADARRAS